ncbi:DUF1690-domain-containing protein [Aulographum hederae CBS 113979]|uniref:DUF1690-domain-containing protein n=1 Tax=Aulographum hederae CBS 113979 TaxID=1176131 RepID=A0A6G1HEP5_9PEZI|nr:DUF1690-domain-containing protein [Aulographum hederae CBS 113979]
MGAGNSKPESEQHVFSADAPVRFSTELVNSLQHSSQSDTTRSKTLELQIQNRVNAELSRLRQAEEDRLSTLSNELSSEAEAPPPEPSLTEKIADSISGSGSKPDITSTSVSKEIAALKEKLEKSKKIMQADSALEKAKESVVTCLRGNDRRPLDCWQEVETFKREVGRLEREFVERTVR